MTVPKTALFIAGAALFHALATLILFVAFLFLYVMIVIPHIPAGAVFAGFPALFIAAFVLSTALYRGALKALSL
ncbi:MAG: hypothetical protein LBH35_03545 [Treponema sp.]|jgi:hypothetical protein|nr:hypothetical protein [Treponema sp.]